MLHAAVFELVAFAVDLFGLGGDELAGDLAADFEGLAVVVDGVGGVGGGEGKLRGFLVAVLSKVGEGLGVPELEIEAQVFVVGEEVGHSTPAF